MAVKPTAHDDSARFGVRQKSGWPRNEMKTDYDAPFPIEGMTVHPMGLPMMLEAWAGLVSYCSSDPKALDAFKEQTSKELRSLQGRAPIYMMVDMATGYDRALVCAFADWVTSTLWGIEGQEVDTEEMKKMESFLTGRNK